MSARVLTVLCLVSAAMPSPGAAQAPSARWWLSTGGTLHVGAGGGDALVGAGIAAAALTSRVELRASWTDYSALAVCSHGPCSAGLEHLIEVAALYHPRASRSASSLYAGAGVGLAGPLPTVSVLVGTAEPIGSGRVVVRLEARGSQTLQGENYAPPGSPPQRFAPIRQITGGIGLWLLGPIR